MPSQGPQDASGIFQTPAASMTVRAAPLVGPPTSTLQGNNYTLAAKRSCETNLHLLLLFEVIKMVL